MPSVGSVLVDVAMRLAGFSRDANTVTNALKNIQKTADDVGKNIKRSIAAFVSGIAVTALARDFKEVTDNADRAGKAAQAVGITVEQYSKLKIGAELSGADPTKLLTGMRALNRALSESEDPTKVATKLLKAFGVQVDDTTTAFDVLPQIADKFKTLEDGPLKAAAAAKLLGDEVGSALIPYLNQGSEGIAQLNKLAEDLGLVLTNKATDGAQQFNDSLNLVSLTWEQMKREGYELAYGPLTALTETFLELRKTSVASAEGVDELADTKAEMIGWAGAVVEVLATIIDSFTLAWRLVTSFGKAVGGVAAVFDAFRSGNFRGALAAGEAMVEDISTSFNAETIGQKLRDAFDKGVSNALTKTAQGVPSSKGAKDLKTALAGILGNKDAQNEKAANELTQRLKQQLQIALSETARAFSAETSLLSDRTGFLDIALRQNLLSYQEYHNRKLNAQRLANEEQLKLVDQELAILQRTRDQLPKQQDKTEVDAKIRATIEKRTEIVRKQQVEEAKGYYELIEVNKKYQDQIENLNADLAERQGDIGLATSMREAIKYRDLLTDAINRGDTATVSAIEKLKLYAQSQAGINKVQERTAIIRQSLSIEEERIDRERNAGTIGELEYLKRVSEARRRALPELQAQAAKYRELVEKNPFDEKARADLELYEEELRKLAESSDLVKDRFSQIVQGGLSTFFTDILDGTKSVKDAFKSMVNSIVQSINRLVAEDISKRIFKGITGDGGWIDALGKLLGGSGNTSAAGPVKPSGGILGSIGGFFAGLFAAEGGQTAANAPRIVGEAGGEAFVPGATSTSAALAKIAPRSSASALISRIVPAAIAATPMAIAAAPAVIDPVASITSTISRAVPAAIASASTIIDPTAPSNDSASRYESNIPNVARSTIPAIIAELAQDDVRASHPDIGASRDANGNVGMSTFPERVAALVSSVQPAGRSDRAESASQDRERADVASAFASGPGARIAALASIGAPIETTTDTPALERKAAPALRFPQLIEALVSDTAPERAQRAPGAPLTRGRADVLAAIANAPRADRGALASIVAATERSGAKVQTAGDAPALIGADGPTWFRPTRDGWIIPHHVLQRELRNVSTATFNTRSVRDIFRAEGGAVSSGFDYIGGERGLEMFVPKQSRSRQDARRAMNVTVNFSLGAPTDTRTQQQIGRIVQEQISRAHQRNG